MSTITSGGSNPIPFQYAFSKTPTIVLEKFNGKNYLAWSSFVEFWFLGQGFSNHLKKTVADIPEAQRNQWEKLDLQFCALLRQSIEPSILSNVKAFKTCSSLWKKIKSVYTNDIRRLYDACQKLASLKQTNHDLGTYISKVQAAIEELKMLLQADTVEGYVKKLDNLYMVMALRGLHRDYGHIRVHILKSPEVPTMDNLVTRLLRVPSLKTQPQAINDSATTATCNRECGDGIVERNSERARRNGGRGGARPQCSHCRRVGHTVDTCYSLKGFPEERRANISLTEQKETNNPLQSTDVKIPAAEYREYLEFMKMRGTQQVQSATATSSIACISQFGNSQN